MAELTRRDCRRVLERLEALADELGQISSWLSGFDGPEDRASIALECATRDVQAAGWVLDRDSRTRPDAWLGPAGGYRGG